MLSRLRHEKKGFTLIELIMVIVILGIVAAVAVPKFISLKSSAQAGVVRGTHAAMIGTIQQLQAQYLLGDIASYDGNTVVGNTTAQGISLSADIPGTSITATFKGKTYVWTFASGTGDAAATVVLTAAGTGDVGTLSDLM